MVTTSRHSHAAAAGNHGGGAKPTTQKGISSSVRDLLALGGSPAPRSLPPCHGVCRGTCLRYRLILSTVAALRRKAPRPLSESLEFGTKIPQTVSRRGPRLLISPSARGCPASRLPEGIRAQNPRYELRC